MLCSSVVPGAVLQCPGAVLLMQAYPEHGAIVFQYSVIEKGNCDVSLDQWKDHNKRKMPALASRVKTLEVTRFDPAHHCR